MRIPGGAIHIVTFLSGICFFHFSDKPFILSFVHYQVSHNCKTLSTEVMPNKCIRWRDLSGFELTLPWWAETSIISNGGHIGIWEDYKCGLVITAVANQGKHLKFNTGGNVTTKARNRIPTGSTGKLTLIIIGTQQNNKEYNSRELILGEALG